MYVLEFLGAPSLAETPLGVGELRSRADAIRGGLRAYFTGKPCKYGHISERNVSKRDCLACIRVRDLDRLAAGKAAIAKRRQENPPRLQTAEERAARRKAHYQTNRDRLCKTAREYRHSNIEKLRRQCNEWHKKNRLKIKKNEKIYRERNRELHNARGAAWLKAHPERRLEYVHRRRARKLLGGGSYTPEQIDDLFKKQRGKCVHCLGSLAAGYHIDHRAPLARGGSNWITNIDLLCPTCNFRKSAKDPIEFAQEEGRLL